MRMFTHTHSLDIICPASCLKLQKANAMLLKLYGNDKTIFEMGNDVPTFCLKRHGKLVIPCCFVLMISTQKMLNNRK